MPINEDERLTKLERKPIVVFYIEFSRKSASERKRIIDDYDAYLMLSENSEAGKLFAECRRALEKKEMATVLELSGKAREMLASGDYEKAPCEFDPKFIGNHGLVREYRMIMAKKTASIPVEYKETLL